VSIIAVASIISLYASSLNRTFIFTWSKGEQEIVDGTLRMRISFQWKNESLSIIAEINDVTYHVDSVLGLVFDSNGNDTLDRGEQGYIFCPLPYWCIAFLYDGRSMGGRMPMKSPYHTCVFQENIGYTYNISIPKSELSKVKANVVHIYYWSKAADDYGSAFEKCWVWARARGWQ